MTRMLTSHVRERASDLTSCRNSKDVKRKKPHPCLSEGLRGWCVLEAGESSVGLFSARIQCQLSQRLLGVLTPNRETFLAEAVHEVISWSREDALQPERHHGSLRTRTVGRLGTALSRLLSPPCLMGSQRGHGLPASEGP